MADYQRLSEAAAGAPVTAFAIVRQTEEKKTRAGSPYLNLLLADPGGEVTARLWDSSAEDAAAYRAPCLVKVRGNMSEWQGRKQFQIEKIRLATAADGVFIEDFVPAAPIRPETMYDYLWEQARAVGHPGLRALLTKVLSERRAELLVAPAATHNHHAVRAGLLYHTQTMLQAGLNLLPVYPFLNKDLLVSGVILHDLAKIDEMLVDELGQAADYTPPGHLLGHLIQGVLAVSRLSAEVGLDEETALLLEHMLLSHHYTPEFGSPRYPAFPEAEVLHHLDALDARLYDMRKIMSEVPPGGFSERIWRLDNRRLYRPKERLSDQQLEKEWS